MELTFPGGSTLFQVQNFVFKDEVKIWKLVAVAEGKQIEAKVVNSDGVEANFRLGQVFYGRLNRDSNTITMSSYDGETLIGTASTGIPEGLIG
jgi:hypothetical protein